MKNSCLQFFYTRFNEAGDTLSENSTNFTYVSMATDDRFLKIHDFYYSLGNCLLQWLHTNTHFIDMHLKSEKWYEDM